MQGEERNRKWGYRLTKLFWRVLCTVYRAKSACVWDVPVRFPSVNQGGGHPCLLGTPVPSCALSFPFPSVLLAP